MGKRRASVADAVTKGVGWAVEYVGIPDLAKSPYPLKGYKTVCRAPICQPKDQTLVLVRSERRETVTMAEYT